MDLVRSQPCHPVAFRLDTPKPCDKLRLRLQRVRSLRRRTRQNSLSENRLMGKPRTYWHIFWMECLAVFLEAIRPLVIVARWFRFKRKK